MRSRVSPLLVLSHMRSYSTLVCHILGSHPEIDGYCETHLKYRSRLDLLRLRWRVRRLTGAPLHGHYLLDKILHDYPITPAILAHARTRALILVRRPSASIHSILTMGRQLGLIAWHQEPEAVARYYETRLRTLTQLAGTLGGRALLVRSERLIADPAAQLSDITQFLGLHRHLEQNYRHFPHTGQPGCGDPIAIGASHTLELRRERDGDAPLPGARLQALEAAYAHALKTMSPPHPMASEH